MYKKILASFLSFAMVLTLLPLSVFAAEGEGCTVTFQSHDGEVFSSESYQYGDTLVVPDEAAAEYYRYYEVSEDTEIVCIFTGWEPEVEETVTGDATYTATYAEGYTITFDADGGYWLEEDGYSENYDPVVVWGEAGSSIEAPEDPMKAYMVFDGWDTELPETMPGENLVIRAKWVDRTEYKITMIMNELDKDGEEFVSTPVLDAYVIVTDDEGNEVEPEAEMTEMEGAEYELVTIVPLDHDTAYTVTIKRPYCEPLSFRTDEDVLGLDQSIAEYACYRGGIMFPTGMLDGIWTERTTYYFSLNIVEIVGDEGAVPVNDCVVKMVDQDGNVVEPSEANNDENGHHVTFSDLNRDNVYTLTVSREGYEDWIWNSDGSDDYGNVWLDMALYGGGLMMALSTWTPMEEEEDRPVYIPTIPSVPATPAEPDGETVKNENGSVTTTVTDKETGTVTETTEFKDGTTATVTTTADGKAEAEVSLPEAAVKSGETVTLPVSGSEVESVTVSIPENTIVKVEVPVENVTPGTVLVIVHEDGTEEIVKKSTLTEDGVAMTLTEGATLRVVENSKSFSDVAEDYWGGEAIDFVSSRELMKGDGNGIANPEGNMCRGDLAIMLHNLEGNPSAEYGGAYSDINANTYYAEAAQWATDLGLMGGYGETFGGLDSVTREQFALILWRYAGMPKAEETLESFGDADGVSSYSVDAMCWAVENGIVQGVGDGSSLAPTGLATRAQVAAMLMRFMNL